MDSFALAHTEHIAGDLKRLVHDLVWQARPQRSSSRQDLLVVAEHQSSMDTYMALHVAKYSLAAYS